MLTSPAQILILTLILNKPGIYLHEIQMELVDLLELEVNISDFYMQMVVLAKNCP